MISKTLRMLFVLVALAGLGLGAGCKSDCEKVAASAKKCIGKAKNETLKELTEECKRDKEKGKKWVKTAIKCADKHGTDCKKFNKCMGER